MRKSLCGLLFVAATCQANSMEHYLQVLERDPSNAEAHAQITRITLQIESERQQIIRERRLTVLHEAAIRLEQGRLDPAPIVNALHEIAKTEQKLREDHWDAQLSQARSERLAGRIFIAQDLVFQVLAQNSRSVGAQQELSLLQGAYKQRLDSGSGLGILERYAIEGFYAFGQADYATAVTAWNKLRTLSSSNPGFYRENPYEEMRITAYDRIAQAHVIDDRRIAELKALLAKGIELFERKQYVQSLEIFRKIAILDPELPQLGFYLVQAEAASEKERAARLGEEQHRVIDRLFQESLDALEKENFNEAETKLENVLRLDPTHPQAAMCLTFAKAELQKRHDPRAAQMHYEAGLVAYASGKLDEAAREWSITVRMNPSLEKAHHALSKVRKEMALARTAPELFDEIIP